VLLQARELMDAQYARALQLVHEHHEEIVALYLELWHRKVRGASYTQHASVSAAYL
jgi:hypothetical protein